MAYRYSDEENMKLDEDLGPDREEEFQTDDEENQAERVCEDESDSDSENMNCSPVMSNSGTDINNPSWPQSYRYDQLASPSIIGLEGRGLFQPEFLHSSCSNLISQQSMDMLTGLTPPSSGFFTGASAEVITSSLTSVYRRRQRSDVRSSSSLSKPLISSEIYEEEATTYILPGQLHPHPHSNLSNYELPLSNGRGSVPTNLLTSDLPSSARKSSVAQAILNGTNVLCGVGLLTTPYALKEGGWLSLVILSLFGIICCYTGLLLKECLESSPGLQTYPDVGQAAFGAFGRLIISVVLYIELYATCVEYTIMMSDNLSILFPNMYMSLAGIPLDSHQIFSILSTLIVLPTVWLRDLTLLSYLSVGGVGASILVAICLVWVGAVEKVGFHPTGTALNLANLPVAIGIYGFGFSGHSVFPNIYYSMKEPSKLPIVLIISFVFCWVMYTGVAVCGFLMFGDSIKSQYTLNMPAEIMASKVAVWTTVINPMTKYALNMMPVALCLEELMPLGRLRSYSMSLIIRTILVASTLIVALKVPFFGFVMALIGSLLAMLVAVIFPCACYLKILHGRLTKFQIGACIFTIWVGVVCGCVGTYSAVSRIAGQIGSRT